MNQSKLILLLSFFFVFDFQADAQYGGCYTKEDLQSKFLTTKTLVFLTGDEDFDANVKKGMEEYWTLTKYEFVDNEKLNEIGYSTEYSIIQPYQIIRTDDYGTQTYYYWGVVLPADKGVGTFENIVANVLLDGFGREKELVGSTYRAKHMVKFLSDFITMKLADEIDCGCGANQAFLKKHFNLSAGKIKEKTLLVDEYYIKKDTKEAFAKHYTGKVKFVSTNEIEEAINDKDDAYCYLLPVFTRHKHIYIVDASSGDIYYELYATSGIELSSRDIKAMGAAIIK